MPKQGNCSEPGLPISKFMKKISFSSSPTEKIGKGLTMVPPEVTITPEWPLQSSADSDKLFKGVGGGGIKSHLFFFLHFFMLYSYLSWFQKVLICLLTLLGSDFIFEGGPSELNMGLKGQKYRVLTRDFLALKKVV